MLASDQDIWVANVTQIVDFSVEVCIRNARDHDPRHFPAVLDSGVDAQSRKSGDQGDCVLPYPKRGYLDRPRGLVGKADDP